jgi:inorganic pyrophosphatase
MNTLPTDTLRSLSHLFKAHPWHGIPAGEECPHICNAFIEIVPNDTIKYEIDKFTGHMCIDRPQKYSSQCPVPYGFIPQTYCADLVGAYSSEKSGIKNLEGDGDAIDVCILTEKQISHAEIVARVVPIGGFRMIDSNEADDKIIAVLSGDGVYGQWTDISECPKNLIERLKHYFLTYKEMPGKEKKVSVTDVYGAAEAREVILKSRQDYTNKYGNYEATLKKIHAEA